jgi:Flp pilus assembly pilin Flp
MKNLLKMLWYEDAAQDLTEYALILVLISLVAIVAMKVIGSTVHDAYSNASSNMASAAS